MKIQLQNYYRKKKGAVPEGRAPVDRADITLCAASVLVPVAQHLVGEDPKEHEEMVVARRQFDGELALVLGIWAIDQALRETLAVDLVDAFVRIEEPHEVSLDVAWRDHRHLPVVEVVPHRERGAVRELHPENWQTHGLRGVLGDHLHTGLNYLVLFVRLGEKTRDLVPHKDDLVPITVLVN